MLVNLAVIIRSQSPACPQTSARRHLRVEDPELQAEAAKMRLDVDARTGEEVQKLVEKLYATSPDLLVVLRKASDSGK